MGERKVTEKSATALPLFEEPGLENRWLAWRYQSQKGRKTKVPLNPRSGLPAKTNDPSTWATLKLAEACASKSGIGIVLGRLDEDRALCGIDLDTCRNPETGEFEPWASHIIDRLDSYTEVSPSKTGAKIFFITENGIRSEQNSLANWSDTHPPAIDLFTSGRFFTVTGDSVGQRALRRVTRKDLDWVVAQGRKLAGKPKTISNVSRTAGTDLATIAANKPLGLSLKDVESVLNRLDHDKWCENRNGWWTAGAAIHHEFGGSDQGLDIWNDFSRRSAKFDEADNRRTWKGFNAKSEPVTFRTLIQEVGGLDTDSRKDAPHDGQRTFLTAADLKDMPRPYDFVRGLLFDGQLSVVYGQPGSGKSFLVFDVASAVSHGQVWANRQTDQRNVLIVPLEGLGTLADRIRAWEIDRKRECRIIFSKEPLDLRRGEAAVAEIIEYVTSHKVGLVIIDTLARAMPGADENAFQDMSTAIRGADQIREATGAHVMLVHHSGKTADRGARGHSSLTGAADLMIEVIHSKQGGTRSATVTKNRSGLEGATISFTLNSVRTDLEDVRGDPISAAVVCVMNERFEDIDAKAPPKLTPDEDRLLKTAALLTRHADIFGYERGLIPAGDLKRQVYQAGWRSSDQPDSRRRQYNRARRSLIERHKLLEKSGKQLKLAASVAGTIGTRRDKPRRPTLV